MACWTLVIFSASSSEISNGSSSRAKLLLEGHDELHQVQGIGVEILGERSLRGHFRFIDAELVCNDGLHTIQDCRHYATSLYY